MQPRRGQHIQHAGSKDCRKTFDGVEPGGSERAVLRRQATGSEHQQRDHRHRLTKHLEQLQDVEVVTNPLGSDLRAASTGQRQQSKTDSQNPSAVDPRDVAQGRHQR
ncbi:hypothetical protein D9M70_638740 [compost metagenome]